MRTSDCVILKGSKENRAFLVTRAAKTFIECAEINSNKKTLYYFNTKDCIKADIFVLKLYTALYQSVANGNLVIRHKNSKQIEKIMNSNNKHIFIRIIDNNGQNPLIFRLKSATRCIKTTEVHRNSYGVITKTETYVKLELEK